MPISATRGTPRAHAIPPIVMPFTILPWRPSNAAVTVAPVFAQENDDRFRELIDVFGYIPNNQMSTSLHSEAFLAVRQGVSCVLVNSGGGAPYN
jgi:hypothetical protein